MSKTPKSAALPRSSLPELKKILKAYAHLGKDVSLESLSKLVGIGPTTVSANNKFLIAAGLLEGGHKKTATALGARLGRALEHSQGDEIQSAWSEAIGCNEFLSNLVTTVRLKSGMTVDNLISHLQFAAGLAKNPSNATGARTVVDILVESGLLTKEDNLLNIATPTENSTASSGAQGPSDSNGEANMPNNPPPDPASSKPKLSTASEPTIAINIQLQIPAVNDGEIYDKLFAALRKHLLTHDD